MSITTFEEIIQNFANNIQTQATKLRKELLLHEINFERQKTESTEKTEIETFEQNIVDFQFSKQEEIAKMQKEQQEQFTKDFISILDINEIANFITVPILRQDDVSYILQFPYHYTLKAIHVIIELISKAEDQKNHTHTFYSNSITALESVGILDKLAVNKKSFTHLKDFDFENEPLASYPIYACYLPSIIKILSLWVAEYQKIASKKKS